MHSMCSRGTLFSLFLVTVVLLISLGTRLLFLQNNESVLDSINLLSTSNLRGRTHRGPCTHALLRSYYQGHYYFPGNGKWLKSRQDIDYFQPGMCQLESRISPDTMQRCLSAGNITNVVTMGDSNGMRMSQALGKFISTAASGDCKCVAKEACVYLKPDVSYFNKSDEEWTKHIQATYRQCACCGAKNHVCTMETEAGPHKIKIEHLGLTQIIDDSIQIHVPEMSSRNPEELWAPTTQEFYFRYHLRQQYPDILIVFLPFNHVKTMTVDRAFVDMQYFKLLADYYFPNTTKIFFIPAFAEFEAARENSEIWYNRRFEKRLATEQIQALNHKLYDLIETDIVNGQTRIYGFFDQLEISRSQGNWSVDAVHMKPVWYEATMTMFWSLLCNSILEDAF